MAPDNTQSASSPASADVTPRQQEPGEASKFVEPTPTVGRIVHVFERSTDPKVEQKGPYAAIITHVHRGTPPLINAAMFNESGGHSSRTSIPHVSSPSARGGMYWAWPPRVS